MTVTAASNPTDAERTGRVVVAGVSAEVRQAARVTEPCSYTLSPESQNYSAAGGSGSIAVQTNAGCRWSVTVDDPWVTLQTTQGEGPGPLQYAVAANDGFASRSTQIRVNDRRATISQDGRPTGECSYTVVPTTATLHWHHEGLNIQLTTAGGCTWTATAASWIDLDGFTSGSGTTTIVPRMSVYTAESPRTGAVEIRWPTATAGQNVWITQEGCHYYIDSNATVPAAGGRQTKTLLASPASVDCMVGCPWTATVDVSWIHIVNPSGAGDDLLFFDVDANTTGVTRTGVIRIPGRTLTVTQDR
jgi:hypothetical protein